MVLQDTSKIRAFFNVHIISFNQDVLIRLNEFHIDRETVLAAAAPRLSVVWPGTDFPKLFFIKFLFHLFDQDSAY